MSCTCSGSTSAFTPGGCALVSDQVYSGKFLGVWQGSCMQLGSNIAATIVHCSANSENTTWRVLSDGSSPGGKDLFDQDVDPTKNHFDLTQPNDHHSPLNAATSINCLLSRRTSFWIQSGSFPLMHLVVWKSSFRSSFSGLGLDLCFTPPPTMNKRGPKSNPPPPQGYATTPHSAWRWRQRRTLVFEAKSPVSMYYPPG